MKGLQSSEGGMIAVRDISSLFLPLPDELFVAEELLDFLGEGDSTKLNY